MTDSLIILFVVMAVLAAFLARVCIWSPSRLRVKVAALLVTALFLPVTFSAFAALLSRPKPVDVEWGHQQAEEAVVLAARFEEGQAIYIWLALPEAAEPRSYQLPWSEETARALHEAQKQAGQEGLEVKMRQPFETTLDPDQPRFYAAPQDPLPDKSLPDENPLALAPIRGD